jgi:flavin-dependent dehydrogenase
MENYEILIVGSGPAGIATAMSLAKRRPDLVDRMVVVDKEVHPRHKLCGGGVTFTAHPVLEHIGIPIESIDVPHIRIDTIEVRYRDKTAEIRFPGAFRTVRRDEFDAELVRRARAVGIEIREGLPVTDIQRHPERGVVVHTPKGKIRAQAVVGADGAKSFVRRKMDLHTPSRVSRLVEVLTPEDPETLPHFRENRAVFDFSPCDNQVQGYYWDFPCFKGGKAFMNRGIFDSRIEPHREMANLKEALASELSQRGRDLAQCKLEGHPERWFDPDAQYSNPNIILVGDAAGVEPLFGEGIAYALMYGPFAAKVLDDAVTREDFSFSSYEESLAADPLGQSLRRRTRMARWAYSRKPGFFRRIWPLVPLGAKFVAWRSRGTVSA